MTLIARNWTSRWRLGVVVAMAVLLLLCLAYWWLDNVPHELFGTAMFVLLGWHVFTNRSWFSKLTRGRYGPRRILVVALHLALIANMLILLVTSVFVSKSMFRILGLPDGALLSEIHWFSAYWVIVAVGIHVGLQWPRLAGVVRSAINLPPAGPVATWSLRACAGAAALFGMMSLPVLDVGTKLSFGYSVDFWDFEASVLPFFVRWGGVIALAAVAGRVGDAALTRIRIARS